MVIQFQLLLIIREDFADFVKVHFVIENFVYLHFRVGRLGVKRITFTTLYNFDPLAVSNFCEDNLHRFFGTKKV